MVLRRVVSLLVFSLAIASPVFANDPANQVLSERKDILRQLQGKKYSELNSFLDARVKDMETNIQKEADVWQAFSTFMTPDPSMEKYLVDWIKGQPSASAYAARAMYYDGMAWASRGGKWANETTENQTKAMQDFFENAHADATRTLLLDPKHPIAFSVFLDLARAFGAEEGSRKIMEEAEKAWPQSVRLKKRYMYSLLPRWGGSYEKMQIFAEQSQKYIKENPEIRTLLGYPDWDRANMSLVRSLTAEGLAESEKALSFGDDANFYEMRSRAYGMMMKNQEALRDADKAIELNPLNEDLYQLRAVIHHNLGNLEESVHDAETVNELRKMDVEASSQEEQQRFELVKEGYHKEEASLDDSIKKFTEAIALNPQDYQAYYYRGQAYAQKMDLANAERDLNKALELNPSDFYSYQQMDWVLAKQKRWNDIIRYWSEYIRLKPTDDKGYFQRGGTYYLKKDWSHARDDAFLACTLGNTEACVKQKLMDRRLNALNFFILTLIMAVIAKLYFWKKKLNQNTSSTS